MHGNRWIKWLKRIGMGIGILILFFFLVFMPFALSWLIINGTFRFPDPDNAKTPADLGVRCEEVQFESDPGITLHGWYLPAQQPPPSSVDPPRPGPRGTVILCHGLNRSRAEMLSRAVFLAQNNYNALIFDFRHHGMSGGKISSMGYYESRDVGASVRFLETRQDFERPLVLWGVSMGASAALLESARNPKVQAIISDSSFLSFEDTIVHHAKMFLRLPRFPIADEILWITSWRLGFRMEDFDLRRVVKEIGPRPILFIAGGADIRMPPEVAKTLYAASPSPDKQLLIIEGARHGAAYRTRPQEYQKAVLDFLQKNLKEAGAKTSP